MPTAPDPSTRDHLLDAAEALFARQGFEATTIKQLGKAAGVNPALLYYYFADKESLYRAVLQRIADELVRRGGAELDRAATPVEAVRGVVSAQAAFLIGQPAVPRLLVRELIDHEARHAEQAILTLAAGLFRRLCGAIETGQREGVFRRDLEPRFAAISTVAQVVHFTVARPAVALLFGRPPGDLPDEITRAFGLHAAEFALAALTVPAAG